jgi:hypothetical protein
LITADRFHRGFWQPEMHSAMMPNRMIMVSFYNMMTTGVGVTAKFYYYFGAENDE